eukprot:scaffold752_cov322-Pavlova_lutheri.AAC.46
MRNAFVSTTMATLLAMAMGQGDECRRCEGMAMDLRDALRNVEPEVDGSVFRARRMRHPRSELDIVRVVEETYEKWLPMEPEIAGWIQMHGDAIDDYVYEEGPEHVPWLLCETLTSACPTGHFVHHESHMGDEL